MKFQEEREIGSEVEEKENNKEKTENKVSDIQIRTAYSFVMKKAPKIHNKLQLKLIY